MKVKIIKKRMEFDPHVIGIYGVFWFLIGFVLSGITLLFTNPSFTTQLILTLFWIVPAIIMVILSYILGEYKEVKHEEEVELLTTKPQKMITTEDGLELEKGEDNFLYLNGKKYRGKDGRFIRIVSKNEIP